MRLQQLLFFPLSLLSLTYASIGEQVIMGSPDVPFVPQTHAKPRLSDLLTLEPSASIFFSYARELELSKILEGDGNQYTLFVPTNKAVMALPRKPQQGEGPFALDNGPGVSQQEFDNASKANVQRWVSAHIIPGSITHFDLGEYRTLLEGKTISFKPIPNENGDGPEWTRVTLEDGIRITKMKQAENGVFYLIDGAISPE